MDIFGKLKQDLSKDSESKDLFIPVFHTVEYTISTIVDKINNIDKLDESEIKNIIIRQHSMILNYDLFLKSNESRVYAQTLFTNKRFLEIFLEVIGLIELTREEIVCVNKLAYDFYITHKNDKSEISDLLLQISWTINNILVMKLSGKLGINGARILAMIANSSFREEKNIHRINTFLVKCNLDLSVQDMIDIYCILFNRFTTLFTVSMTETKTSNLTDGQVLLFNNISSALLAILNSMTDQDIKKVLYNYGYRLKLINTNYSVRFSLKTAVQYPRILNSIHQIELEDDIQIP